MEELEPTKKVQRRSIQDEGADGWRDGDGFPFGQKHLDPEILVGRRKSIGVVHVQSVRLAGPVANAYLDPAYRSRLFPT